MNTDLNLMRVILQIMLVCAYIETEIMNETGIICHRRPTTHTQTQFQKPKHKPSFSPFSLSLSPCRRPLFKRTKPTN